MLGRWIPLLRCGGTLLASCWGVGLHCCALEVLFLRRVGAWGSAGAAHGGAHLVPLAEANAQELFKKVPLVGNRTSKVVRNWFRSGGGPGSEPDPGGQG